MASQNLPGVAALRSAGYAMPISKIITLSGLTLGGVGSAFWGVEAGAFALFVQQWRPRRQVEAPPP